MVIVEASKASYTLLELNRYSSVLVEASGVSYSILDHPSVSFRVLEPLSDS